MKAWRISGSLYILPFALGFIPLYIFVDEIQMVPFIELYALVVVFLFFMLVFPSKPVAMPFFHPMQIRHGLALSTVTPT